MRDVIADALIAMKSERAKLDAAIAALESAAGTSTRSGADLPTRRVNGQTKYEIAPGRWVGRARLAQLGIPTPKKGRQGNRSPRSADERQRMSEAMKQRWADRKAQRVADGIGNQAETRELVPA